jgi:hypothetical protein
VAAAYGHSELSNLDANHQVDHMQSHWLEISALHAQGVANGGGLAIAGCANPAGHGHTAVVTPGQGAYHGGNFTPNVTGGGTMAGRSDGTRTAGDVWRANADVHYYTPTR